MSLLATVSVAASTAFLMDGISILTWGMTVKRIKGLISNKPPKRKITKIPKRRRY